MIEEERRRRAAKRVTPGDGRPLERFRWWQSLSRALFYLRLTNKSHLYLDGRQHAVSKIPAAFSVRGGTIEVAMSAFGLRRCHYVALGGSEHQLVPDPDSAEGRRANCDRVHPALSRGIGFLSLIVLVVGLIILISQLIAQLTLLPPVAEHIGAVVSPVRLPMWGNMAIAIAAVAASTERALRLGYSVLLDGGAG